MSQLEDGQHRLEHKLDTLAILAAQPRIDQIKNRGPLAQLSDAEFRVFSQFGDDGIIQYLVHLIDPQPHTLIEFGVEDYVESNTRFLLYNNHWSGLVMDGNAAGIERWKSRIDHWKHDLVAACEFVTRENINQLFEKHGFTGRLGLLHIDVDGIDYYLWETIEVIDPIIVILEYNSLFGPHAAVTIPYDEQFERFKAHYSGLYWGTSLGAFCRLAERKNYALVGCNSAGNNAYFVKQERLGPLAPLTSEQGYKPSLYRKSRGADGNLIYRRGPARLAEIRDLPVVNLETGRIVRIADVCSV